MAKKGKLSEDEKEYLKTRWEASLNNYNYSEKRLDLLIITISGAGIYVCLESLRFIIETNPCAPTWLLKTAGLILIIAIIINFVSQIFGKLTNKYDSFMCENATIDEKKSLEYEKKSNKYDKYVSLTNWISYISLFLGLIALTLHYLIYF